MRVPILPGVPAGELLIFVWDSGALEFMVKSAVGLNQGIVGAAIKTKRWQAMGVAFQAGNGLQRLIFGEIKRAGAFQDEGLEIGGIGHAAVSGEGGVALGMKGSQTQGTVATHGQAAEKVGSVGDVGIDERNRSGDFIDDPSAIVRVAVTEVTGAVTPETVGRHGQSHWRQAFRFNQTAENLMGARFEKPGPMTAIDPMEQCDQWQWACFDARRNEDTDVSTPMKRWGLHRDEMQARWRVVGMGNFDGGEMDGHAQ